jgi:sulfotransferase family protein
MDRTHAPGRPAPASAVEIPLARPIPKVVFVGGTGRSGTHIVAQLLGRSHNLAMIPVEVRFHTDPDGFPGLLAGEISLERFVRKLRGYWWKGFQSRRFRGMFRFVDRERFDAAVSVFERSFASDREEACRRLFFDLLWFRTEAKPTLRGLVEQSCDTVAQAPTLLRLFDRARFIHVVRDGRDASASRVSQTRGLIKPRTRAEGLEWWERRLARVEAGAKSIPPERLLTVSLDELLLTGGGEDLRPLMHFGGARATSRVRYFYASRMNRERANSERWRRGLSERKAARLLEQYEAALDRLEAADARSVPLLRRTLERTRGDAADEPPRPYIYDGPA